MTEIKWSEGTRPHMQVKEKKGVTWLSYPAFEQFPDIIHAFSTRLGGVSRGIYSSMNLSFTRGDEDTAVYENYRRLAVAVGFEMEDIVTSDQTHTANVRMVTENDRGNGIMRPRPYTDVDGMITNVPGLVLATFYADCVPLYFVDPVHHAIGLSHSGWRGTVAGIGKVTIEKMREEYGTRPEELYTAIGPSICQDCYEVSEDVILEFQHAFARKYWDDLFYKKENGKYQLNLWEANRIIMLEAGIKEAHISMPGICTCCNPEFLFSHRASHGKRGNLGAFLGICRK
ncbi:peptidoglycan editing factor PgeF [Blautia sp. MSJ-19]|uniref:peptidoglycan editing factor PgeF n=1 Tax=Blautia sp. MSJ-19 TaxID=2841517 RepID=UPI001C0EDAD6|nr:peptidoglycan editing factor PgeF [Blautia sp. MSJ-19]MBU5480081.1 peptidoglycan editing factor PgeF [Blautia sp. MSJ-19]